MESEDLKIGKITRAVERSLDFTFMTDVRVYIKSKTLDELASKYPTRVDSIIQQVSDILKHPDFVAFGNKGANVYYVRLYFQGGEFLPLELEIERGGRPHRFFLKRFGKLIETKDKDFRRYVPMRQGKK